MNILVTGGAGYIGSHTVKKLLELGNSVLVLDNLSTGFIEPIKILEEHSESLTFYKVDLKNIIDVEDIFKKHKIDIVIHFANRVSVSESVEKPELYHQVNYLNGINLVNAMIGSGVNKIIYSSSCVVYGNPKYIPIDEKHPIAPICPYAQTKIDYEKYLAKVDNLKYIIFRYFNVGGSDPTGVLGKSNLEREDIIENIMKVALGQKDRLQIFGDDYPTRDGTAIRDFLHVEDIAQAHIEALEKIDSLGREVFNLGSETGSTIKEVVEVAEKVIGKPITNEFAPRRPADIPISVASAKKAKEVLGWNPRLSNLEDIIKTDWNWRKMHPYGYS